MGSRYLGVPGICPALQRLCLLVPSFRPSRVGAPLAHRPCWEVIVAATISIAFHGWRGALQISHFIFCNHPGSPVLVLQPFCRWRR